MTRKLQLVHSNLAEKGIKVIRDEKARPRRIIIQKTGENAVPPVGTDADRNDQPSHQTVSKNNAVGIGDGGNGLSHQSSTEATPPTPLSPGIKDGYTNKELEDINTLEFKEEEIV